ncbi:MAG: succinate dehydrogenase assembly factor 2 [Rhodospirillaceae bacterium]|nr:succinate dehydrogenase assembly factor 2 [Rhodospirillaceae bacterium]OUT80323.1 MAG: hypothetical protein CBB83_02010 [Rhodospirillaceae bacterium TMED23]|tara:strand:+ start:138 stop:389 length:252 start_codon:yes stop_codon:yes gene_type:complete
METLRKKILYKATHRGTKEADRLIGGFAVSEVSNLDEKLLNEFDLLLDVPDVDLVNWVLEREPVKKEYNNNVLRQIKIFKESL